MRENSDGYQSSTALSRRSVPGAELPAACEEIECGQVGGQVVLFAAIERRCTGGQLGRSGALALAARVEAPAVILAPQLFASNFAKAEPHTAMRANVIQGGDLAIAGAKQDHLAAGDLDADRLVAQLLAHQSGMSMIECTHGRTSVEGS